MTRKTISQVPANQNNSNMPIPWNEVFEQLLSRPLPFSRSPSEGEMSLIKHRVHSWEIALHWLIKWEWDLKHKIPAKRTIAKALETKGRFLQRIFCLCERCHTLQDEVSIDVPYRHAAFWFGLVYWEIITNEMHTILEATAKQKKGNKKEAALNERRLEAKMLKERKNPLSKYSPEHRSMKATDRLITSGIDLANKSDAFVEKFWEPFVKAYTAANTRLDDPDFGRTFIENSKAYIQVGRGRGNRLLSPPEDWKSLLEKNGILKRLPSKGFRS